MPSVPVFYTPDKSVAEDFTDAPPAPIKPVATTPTKVLATIQTPAAPTKPVATTPTKGLATIQTPAAPRKVSDKRLKVVQDRAFKLKKMVRGNATPEMFEAISRTESNTAILKMFAGGKIGCGSEVVHIPGTEWPDTEWDTADAWYQGTIVAEGDEGADVYFEDYDEPLPFSSLALDAYAEMHETFKFDQLIDAANFVDMCDF